MYIKRHSKTSRLQCIVIRNQGLSEGSICSMSELPQETDFTICSLRSWRSCFCVCCLLPAAQPDRFSSLKQCDLLPNYTVMSWSQTLKNNFTKDIDVWTFLSFSLVNILKEIYVFSCCFSLVLSSDLEFNTTNTDMTWVRLLNNNVFQQCIVTDREAVKVMFYSCLSVHSGGVSQHAPGSVYGDTPPSIPQAPLYYTHPLYHIHPLYHTPLCHTPSLYTPSHLCHTLSLYTTPSPDTVNTFLN